MTILAVGACMLIAVAAQTQWKAPRLLTPLLKLGQRSYEIYLTHIFAVLALLSVFIAANKPMRYVPALFIAVILIAALLGELVARAYSEPMNRWLRNQWSRSTETPDPRSLPDTHLGHSKQEIINLQDPTGA
jgi:peptidoglycan/LPS O-acetylase OafA/YrhL